MKSFAIFSSSALTKSSIRFLRASKISTKMNKKGNNSRQAKCKLANVFLEGQWSVALYKLYSEVFAKTVNILGMPLLYQLICILRGCKGMVLSLRSIRCPRSNHINVNFCSKCKVWFVNKFNSGVHKLC